MVLYWTVTLVLTTAVTAAAAADHVCYYKGAEYEEGDTILLDEPCLACTCQTSTLVCSLRVCPKLPNPPPSGCVVVHKKNQCCPQIICEDVANFVKIEPNFKNLDVEMGCSMNGGVYSDGSALPSSSLCEFCYCMGGQQRCISPHCSKPADSCQPTYSPYSCCPVHYNCSRSDDNSRKLSEGCHVNGTDYAEGDLVETSSSCQTCYCIGGEVNCQPVRCTVQHMNGCYPVYTHQRCCPVAYDCSNRHFEEIAHTNIDRSLDLEETTVTEIPEITSTALDGTEQTTIWDTTTEAYENSTEDIRFVTGDLDSTTLTDLLDLSSLNESTTVEDAESTTVTATTLEPESLQAAVKVLNLSLRMDNSNATPNFISNEALDLDDLLNSTRADEDYETYDYSEPKLPPSLPNLVIFPFVAADAVTKEKEAEKKIDQVPNPAYYSPFFNPPVETEGGFVPKDDIPDQITYQPIYFDDKVPIIAEDEDELIQHPSITMPPKSKSEICVSEGREYGHGEVLPPLIECITCECLYGDIMCEETRCPDPPAGCMITQEKLNHSCCGSIICEPVAQYATRPPIDITMLPLNDSDIALEPIVTTDNPFRDVIRTEPAPDLPSLMDQILPFLEDQQTKTPVTVNYKNKVVNYYPKHQVTTMNDEQKTTMTIEEHSAVVSSTQLYESSSFDMTSVSPIYLHSTTARKATEQQSRSPVVADETTETSQNYTTTNEPVVVEGVIDKVIATDNKAELSTVRTDIDDKATILGVNPKRTTTTEGSFFDEFFKGFFESADSHNMTTPTPTKINHIYSSKIREPLIISTTTMPSVEIIQNKEGEETETGSFSLDKVFDMLFQAEATEASTKATKTKNNSKHGNRKPQRKTKKPTTTTPASLNTTEKTTSTTHQVDKVDFVVTPMTTTPPEHTTATVNQTGFPKKQQHNRPKVPPKDLVQGKGHVSKQTESSRKPTKVPGSMGGILKLAGCNIYGRMYRVGKIIAELTNPCMKCMCTENGVQCSKIDKIDC